MGVKKGDTRSLDKSPYEPWIKCSLSLNRSPPT